MLEALEAGTAGVLLRTNDPQQARLSRRQAACAGRPAPTGRAGGPTWGGKRDRGRAWRVLSRMLRMCMHKLLKGAGLGLSPTMIIHALIQVRELAAWLEARAAEGAARLVYERAVVTRVAPLGMGDRWPPRLPTCGPRTRSAPGGTPNPFCQRMHARTLLSARERVEEQQCPRAMPISCRRTAPLHHTSGEEAP